MTRFIEADHPEPVTATSRAPPACRVFHHFDLQLLNLGEALPLSGNQVIQLVVKVPNLKLRFEVHAVVVLGAQPILFLLSSLTHHNDRRLQGCKAG
jgi:hypothetical protein